MSNPEHISVSMLKVFDALMSSDSGLPRPISFDDREIIVELTEEECQKIIEGWNEVTQHYRQDYYVDKIVQDKTDEQIYAIAYLNDDVESGQTKHDIYLYRCEKHNQRWYVELKLIGFELPKDWLVAWQSKNCPQWCEVE